MLPFPVPRPTGFSTTASQDSLDSACSSPVKHACTPPHILPLHTTDKPLPLSPTASFQLNGALTSDPAGEHKQTGFKGWWKRNRQRSKGSHSPGQAELGAGSSPERGSRITRYDVDVLTRQLQAVHFKKGKLGRGEPSERLETSPRVFAAPFPPQPTTVQSSPSSHAGTATPTSSRYHNRPPVYALHVGSENVHHSVSAPQLDAKFTSGNGLGPGALGGYSNGSERLANENRVISARTRMTTFEPDSRALERVPDRPVTYMDSPYRQYNARAPAQSPSIPSSYSAPLLRQNDHFQIPHLPLTPSRKPNFSPQTTRTSTPTPTGTAGKSHRLPSTPGSQQKSSVKSPSATGATVQCSGFTQKGQRCKKPVRAVAAYYAMHHVPTTLGIASESAGTINDGFVGSVDDVGLVAGEEEKRFCKVHIGQICSPDGFYVKRGDSSASREKWIQFSDYIPHGLEEQTKVLLRLTMECPLTANESSGYIYAYELRDIATDRVAYYKIGRTDNVPRRLNEWTKQCASHRPTLRDIFPQRDRCAADTASQSEIQPMTSVLPGAMSNQGERCNAVKRLEKLIHIELSARQVNQETLFALTNHHPTQNMTSDRLALLHTARPCADCLTTHREIFAIPRQTAANPGGGWSEYETVVRPVVLRWQRFVDEITM